MPEPFDNPYEEENFAIELASSKKSVRIAELEDLLESNRRDFQTIRSAKDMKIEQMALQYSSLADDMRDLAKRAHEKAWEARRVLSSFKYQIWWSEKSMKKYRALEDLLRDIGEIH